MSDRPDKKYPVGLVAGAFDVIHPGYILLLRDAKSICHHLIVALHRDPSREKPLTKLPPVLSVEERTMILLAIRYVDEVIPYDTEAELFLLLSARKPDVRILGDDYRRMVKRVTGATLRIPVYYHPRTTEWTATLFKERIADTIRNRRKQ